MAGLTARERLQDARWDRDSERSPMPGVPETFAMDYDRAKHYARVLLNESRARRDHPANRNFHWTLLNWSERAVRRALGMSPAILRHRHPQWADHLGMAAGTAVVHRDTGLRGVVAGTMGLYLTLESSGPHPKFWPATEFRPAPAFSARPQQLDLFPLPAPATE